MSDQTSELGPPVNPGEGQPPQPAIDIRSPDELARDVIRAIPALGEAEAAIAAVLTWYVTYVTAPALIGVSTSPEAAFAELEAAREMNREDVQTVFAFFDDSLAHAMAQVADDFAREAGEEVSIDGIARRYQDEREEQQGLRTLATALLQEVNGVCAVMQIPNPATHLDAEPVVEPPSTRERLLGKMRNMAIAARVADPIPEPVALPEPPASWDTPPILAVDDSDVQVLRSVILPRVAQVPTAGLGPVQIILAGLNYDRAAISALLERIVTKARDQIAQCDEALGNVTRSFRGYQTSVEALAELRTQGNAVRDFFFPAR